jgi:hypothetical protein
MNVPAIRPDEMGMFSIENHLIRFISAISAVLLYVRISSLAGYGLRHYAVFAPIFGIDYTKAIFYLDRLAMMDEY